MRGNIMTCPVCITEEENWIVATDIRTNIASQGKSVKEALANLKEALELYYEDADNSSLKKMNPEDAKKNIRNSGEN